MADLWQKDGYIISTDKARLDVDAIHAFLTESYWAEGIALERVEKSIEHSLTFGVYQQGEQVGFARVVTDYAKFAYLADVFVLESHRGLGLGTWLVETVMSYSELQGLFRWMLATRDAHELYRKVGFTELIHPERWMERSKVSS